MTDGRTDGRTEQGARLMICPKCARADCRVSITKRTLQVNVKVTTVTWCRNCWWQEEKSVNLAPDVADKISETPASPR